MIQSLQSSFALVATSSFFGKQHLKLYDALGAGDTSRESNITQSSKTCRRTLTDAESAYGFRPSHPDTFYVSPWEFVQWFKAIQLKMPSSSYPYSVWTPAGKKKRACADDESLVAGEDYVFDFAWIESKAGVYAFPESKIVFDGSAPNSYAAFRSSWILQRRLRPMVPCAENTPLPNRRISKDARAKLLSTYLKPWTLSKKMATVQVP